MVIVTEILGITIKVKTDKNEEKMISITNFPKPNSVNMIYDDDSFTLSIQRVNNCLQNKHYKEE